MSLKVLSSFINFFKNGIPSFWKKSSLAQKKFFIGIGVFLLLVLSIVVVKFVFSSDKKIYLSFDEKGYENEALKPLNKSAKKGFVKDGEAFYKFTKTQIENIKKYHEDNLSTQISARIVLERVDSSEISTAMKEAKPFYFGLLGKNDFDGDNLSDDYSDRLSGGMDLRSFLKSDSDFTFDVSIALPKEKDAELPEGVFISSSLSVRIEGFYVQKAKVGFDLTLDVPLFALPPNGGNFTENGSFDFTGASLAFATEVSESSLMPKITAVISKAQNSENGEIAEENRSFAVNAGGEKLTFYKGTVDNQVVVQTSLLRTPFCRFVYESNPYGFKKLLMEENPKNLLVKSKGKILEPMETDPGMLLGFSNVRWRDNEYELYKWDRFPSILIFDTKDYDVQDQFFKRLAFFSEKAGYKGGIYEDEVIKDMHGFNAHDYRPETLAEFFKKADASGVRLTDKENILREILVKNGVIVLTQNGYVPGKGGVISLSLQIPYGTRYSLCAHELYHGLFFIDDGFRNYSAAIFGNIDKTSQDFIINYWKSQPQLGYDTSDDYLVTNEFMAYVMQQHLDGVGKYFVHLGNRGSVMNYMPELCEWVRENKGITFEDAGRIFESYVYDRWGLACGRVSMIVR